MNWILGDWIRVLVVTGLVSATTGYVWVKVQISETAMGVVQARRASEVLREERSDIIVYEESKLWSGSRVSPETNSPGTISSGNNKFTRVDV